MSNLIATKRVDLLAPYLALDQGTKVQAECESLFICPSLAGVGTRLCWWLWWRGSLADGDGTFKGDQPVSHGHPAFFHCCLRALYIASRHAAATPSLPRLAYQFAKLCQSDSHAYPPNHHLPFTPPYLDPYLRVPC
jgi:hypothetical protein